MDKRFALKLRLPPSFFKLIVRAPALDYTGDVSHKAQHIAALTAVFQGQRLDAHYLGYFDCFNRQLFFEAHEVLEALWLPSRGGPNGKYYQALIQLAGAFVHLQKNRLPPAGALLRLAQANLARYPRQHEELDLAAVQRLIGDWLAALEKGAWQCNPLTATHRPWLTPPLP